METRTYTCADCGVTCEQLAHGGSRRYCADCVSPHAQLMREQRAQQRANPPATRKCLTCGNGFPRSRTPYCSEGCRPLRKCRGCGNEFNRKNRTYCSDECKPQSNRLTYHEKRSLREPRICAAPECGQPFKPCRNDQRWCSMACAHKHKSKGNGVGGPRFSPEEARQRQRLSWQAKNRRRRAAKRGAPSEPYTLAEIAARDGLRCGLCGGRVPMEQTVPHPKAPTIDHIVPIFGGGDDTRANVQLAHFRCNSVKGYRGSQQLALIG